MSIKYRLYGGFGVLVLITIGLVFYGAWVFGDLGTVITRMNSIAVNNARTLQAAEHLEILRRSVLRYVYDHEEASRKENGEVAAKVQALLDGSIQSAPREERKQMYRNMQAGLASLQQVTQTLFDAITQSEADQAKLVKAGAALGARTDELIKKYVDNAPPDQDPAITILILRLDADLAMVRLANIRGQLIHNTNMLPVFDAAVAKAQTAVAALEAKGSEDVRAQVAALRCEYLGLLSSWAVGARGDGWIDRGAVWASAS